MNKDLLKKIGTYAGILLLFVALAYAFTPEVLDGKIVNQGDISQWKGMANEAMTHNEAHPEDPTAWSNAMFGGMPTTATIDTFEGDWTDSIYDMLLIGRRPASYLLIALIGGFLLMLSLGTSTLVAVGGAIATAFCSYNFQIITAGHNTKMQAIAYFPWVLAAVIFTYKAALNSSGLPRRSAPRNDVKTDKTRNDVKAYETSNNVKTDAHRNDVKTDDRYVIPSEAWESLWLYKALLGAVLFAFALSFQIKANHIQITYYLAIVIFAYFLGQLIYICMDKARRSAMLKRFFVASGMLLVIGCVGIATNANKLIPTYEYSKYTMRGGSELSSESETHNKDGLNLEYATQWSYGIEEMPNLLIPNFNGGASSSELAIDSETGKFFTQTIGRAEANRIVKGMPTYWGPQPFTAGPMYMGAITIFLFVLGMILCKGREKWWLFGAIIVTVLLSWGNHFMWFTKLWFDYVPMYNKFRTVSMALIVLQVALPMIGFLALDRVMKDKFEKDKFFKAGGIALAVTAGFCLISIMLPGIAGSFSNASDMAMLEGWPAEYQREFAHAIAADRQGLMIADASRSFVLIIIAAALMALPYLSSTFKSESWRKILAGCVIAAVLFDLWSAGKRYLNESHFITPEKFSSAYTPGEVDKMLHEDTDPNYRVLSIPGFSSAIPSYHHKTIGGYSAVKMQRYDDLLNYYIRPEVSEFTQYEKYLWDAFEKEEITADELFANLDYVMDESLPICSMLNAKYIIGNESLYANPFAFGNSWLIENYCPAETPDEEFVLLGEIPDLYTTAVIGNDFAWAREHFDNVQPDSYYSDYDYIGLTHYAPNELRYEYTTLSDRAAIFSEIYYPKGWKAWIEPAGAYGEVVDGRYQPTADGREIEIFRADWILRGAIIPAGEGQIIMRFEPESYRIGENISRISSILLILMLLGSAAGVILLCRKSN